MKVAEFFNFKWLLGYSDRVWDFLFSVHNNKIKFLPPSEFIDFEIKFRSNISQRLNSTMAMDPKLLALFKEQGDLYGTLEIEPTDD